jgi:hypothetical protein
MATEMLLTFLVIGPGAFTVGVAVGFAAAKNRSDRGGVLDVSVRLVGTRTFLLARVGLTISERVPLAAARPSPRALPAGPPYRARVVDAPSHAVSPPPSDYSG